MALVEMTEDLLVGYFTIDEQHRELFARINELHEAITSKRNANEVNMVFSFLESYVIAHFGMEKTMMEKRDYPEKDSHLAKHTHFINEFSKIRDSFNSHSGSEEAWSDATEMEMLLKDWLVNHIKTVDKKLGDFLGAPA